MAPARETEVHSRRVNLGCRRPGNQGAKMPGGLGARGQGGQGARELGGQEARTPGEQRGKGAEQHERAGQEIKGLGWGHAGGQKCDPLGRKCVENATP